MHSKIEIWDVACHGRSRPGPCCEWCAQGHAALDLRVMSRKLLAVRFKLQKSMAAYVPKGWQRTRNNRHNRTLAHTSSTSAGAHPPVCGRERANVFLADCSVECPVGPKPLDLALCCTTMGQAGRQAAGWRVAGVACGVRPPTRLPAGSLPSHLSAIFSGGFKCDCLWARCAD